MFGITVMNVVICSRYDCREDQASPARGLAQDPTGDTSPLPDASVFEANVVRDYGGRGGAGAKRR
jgi:hypothetical protein